MVVRCCVGHVSTVTASLISPPHHLPEAIIHHMTGAGLTSRALLCVPHISSCEMLETVCSGKHEKNYFFASQLVWQISDATKSKHFKSPQLRFKRVECCTLTTFCFIHRQEISESMCNMLYPLIRLGRWSALCTTVLCLIRAKDLTKRLSQNKAIKNVNTVIPQKLFVMKSEAILCQTNGSSCWSAVSFFSSLKENNSAN